MKLTNHLAICIFLAIPSLSFMLLNGTYSQMQIFAQDSTNFTQRYPNLMDPNLKVELVTDGLLAPTGMLFLDDNNILVLQRYTSGFPLGGLTTVSLITNGSVKNDPVLTVPSGLCDIKQDCNLFNERGLLGISARKINIDNATLAGNLNVFLYYTEITLNGEVLGNRVYRYLWDGNSLVNPKLILDLPALPSQSNVGGKLLIGPDDYLYVVIGDVTISNRTIPIHENPELLEKILCCPIGHRSYLQNILTGTFPDNTSVVLRVNPDTGLPAPDNPFNQFNGSNSKINGSIINLTGEDILIGTKNDTNNNSNSIEKYYAYGIRNSFGIAIDHVTGNLWDTENGANNYDEINLVEPGFNSGWAKIMGPMKRINATDTDVRAYGFDAWKGLKLNVAHNVKEQDLVNLPGSKYSDPEFSWKDPIGVTALAFLNSSKLGHKYKDNLFVGDYANGNLYFFKMNSTRTGIEFNKNQTGLADLVADNADERSRVVLGKGFDIITDIQTGPDGYLYILSYSEYSSDYPDNVSRIYRIVPAK